MFFRRVIAAAAVLTVIGVTAAEVRAQPAPESQAVRRPYRGLFGGPGSPGPHSLVFTGSVYAAYDDNVIEAVSNRRVNRPWLQESGTYAGADAGLSYGFATQGQRTSLGGQLGGRVSYYRHGERSDVLPSSNADVSFGLRLTKSLNLDVRESVAYSSNYNGALAPQLLEESGHDIGTAPIADLDLFGQEALRTATTVSLSQRFGRHTSLAGGYHFRSQDVLETEQPDSRFRDYRTHAGSVKLGYARPVSRHATLNLGYGIRVSDRRSRTGEPAVMHNIDAGVDYSRALSFSRRTSFTFGTGSGIAVTERIDNATGDGDRRTRARLTGHASLTHEMGRTWTADLTYSRGFQTREGFDELYFTDAVSASVGGLVTRRLSFSAGAAWADSSLERGGGNNGHRGTSATAQATFGLTRFVGFFTRYVYYHYRYGNNITLDDRFPRQLDRHGVRVGLTTSVPLIR
jgi:hypothetical protein